MTEPTGENYVGMALGDAARVYFAIAKTDSMERPMFAAAVCRTADSGPFASIGSMCATPRGGGDRGAQVARCFLRGDAHLSDLA